jgi:hypothetical protein
MISSRKHYLEIADRVSASKTARVSCLRGNSCHILLRKLVDHIGLSGQWQASGYLLDLNCYKPLHHTVHTPPLPDPYSFLPPSPHLRRPFALGFRRTGCVPSTCTVHSWHEHRHTAMHIPITGSSYLCICAIVVHLAVYLAESLHTNTLFACGASFRMDLPKS